MTLGEDINNLYDKRSYLDKYGKDIIFALVIAMVLIGINVYLYIINHLKGLRQKWTDPVSPINCKPIYIPFASVINPPPDGKNLEYIKDNAELCIQNALKGEAELLTSPIQVVLNTLIDAFKAIAEILSEFIIVMGKFVDSVIKLLEGISLQMDSSMDTNNDIFGSIINTLERFMTINKVVSYVGQGFADFGMSLIKLLNPAACFDKDTCLVMDDGSIKTISTLSVGDTLLYDGRVTSVMKITSNGSDMYNYKGIVVSGTHYVYEDNSLVKVKDSINSVYYNNYMEKELYCINTESKQIHIGNVTFADYDDLTLEDCHYLKEWIHKKTGMSNIKNYDIHKNMNGGLVDTKIKLNNGSSKWLSNINIGDVLSNNITVLGIVKILPTDMKIKTIKLDNYSITGGNNIQIMDKDKQLCLNIMDEKEPITYTNNMLYHLITDRGGYYLQDIFIGDYSVGMSLFFKEDHVSILSAI